jgi:hypothetical protein
MIRCVTFLVHNFTQIVYSVLIAYFIIIFSFSLFYYRFCSGFFFENFLKFAYGGHHFATTKFTQKGMDH